MKPPTGTFNRDASNRLVYEVYAVDAIEYPKYAKRIGEHFRLRPIGELVVGLDEMFRDYTDGTSTVGIEWDNWSGLIVIAKTESAEPLVRLIATFLAYDSTTMNLKPSPEESP